jgi:hypothetical protein
MRKAIGWVLVGLGTFLLIGGLLLRFYAAPSLKTTPLSVSSTTYLSGTADKLNPGTGEIEDLDVKVTSVTESDDDASDDDVAVFVNTTCVVKDEPDTPDCVDAGTEEEPDERLVTATTDVFATDRSTALSLTDEQDDDYLPSDAVAHEGLVNKWPFDAEKKDYPYWDGLLGEAVTAQYTGTEDLNGLETYVYQVMVQDQPAEVVSGVEGVYSLEKTLKVDPTTGSIIYQSNHDVRTLPNGDPLLDLQVEFTDAQVEENVADAKDSGSSLRLATVILPVVGLVLGLLLIAGGLFLVFGGRDRSDETRPGRRRR